MPSPKDKVNQAQSNFSTDSSAAKALAKSKQVLPRGKHTELKYKFVQLALASGIITLALVDSAENVSDMLTKVLTRPEYIHLCKQLRLVFTEVDLIFP